MSEFHFIICTCCIYLCILYVYFVCGKFQSHPHMGLVYLLYYIVFVYIVNVFLCTYNEFRICARHRASCARFLFIITIARCSTKRDSSAAVYAFVFLIYRYTLSHNETSAEFLVKPRKSHLHICTNCVCNRQ